MRVLVACEFSGIVRDAFAERGHYAMSCDLEATERPGPHYQGDVRDVLYDGWDLMIAHPPCTYLSRAGARWWSDPERQRLMKQALFFVLGLWHAPIERVVIENPIGKLNSLWRYPDQTIHPYHFGHPFSKATCLWLRGVPPLLASGVCAEYQPLLPSNVGEGKRKGEAWSRGTVRGGKDAARTFQGIADAMAHQWG
jgi:hypothetical protein